MYILKLHLLTIKIISMVISLFWKSNDNKVQNLMWKAIKFHFIGHVISSFAIDKNGPKNSKWYTKHKDLW